MSLEFCHHRLLSFCDRFFDDLRPYAIVQLVPCIAFPVMAIMLPPIYTHSTYWLWAAGFYLLAKVEEAADDTIYNWTYHIVSGHTLKHLCAAMVPVFLTLMLAKRDILPERISLLQTWKISWTKYKENGVETENQTITYTSVPFNGSVLVGPHSCRGFGRVYALLHPRVVNNEQVPESPHDPVTVPDHGPFATYIDNAVNNAKKNVPRLRTKKK